MLALLEIHAFRVVDAASELVFMRTFLDQQVTVLELDLSHLLLHLVVVALFAPQTSDIVLKSTYDLVLWLVVVVLTLVEL